MGVFFEFDDVDAFTVGTEGRPGERVFYLQARGNGQRVTLKCEKQQAAAIVQYLRRVLMSCGLVGGEAARGCQPVQAKNVATMSGTDFNALFRPMKDRGGIIQFDVIMQDTAVDDLGLIAIISGVANPSAMLTDAAGVGHTVHRGDHVARPEVVTAGGEEGLSVTLVWRVDRIRGATATSPAEVVLTRDDPSTPDRAPLTRVLVLHPEETGMGSGVTAL